MKNSKLHLRWLWKPWEKTRTPNERQREVGAGKGGQGGPSLQSFTTNCYHFLVVSLASLPHTSQLDGAEPISMVMCPESLAQNPQQSFLHTWERVCYGGLRMQTCRILTAEGEGEVRKRMEWRRLRKWSERWKRNPRKAGTPWKRSGKSPWVWRGPAFLGEPRDRSQAAVDLGAIEYCNCKLFWSCTSWARWSQENVKST